MFGIERIITETDHHNVVSLHVHLWHYICPVSIQPNHDFLDVLRANLRRIEEENYQLRLTPQALEVKALLLHRIAIIETAMENLAAIAAKNQLKN